MDDRVVLKFPEFSDDFGFQLNLASQSVLEGLNACFDHRAEVFIPELGMSFNVQHEKTRIFACQNPLNEGGGRKGLPKSFLNRFTQVCALLPAFIYFYSFGLLLTFILLYEAFTGYFMIFILPDVLLVHLLNCFSSYFCNTRILENNYCSPYQIALTFDFVIWEFYRVFYDFFSFLNISLLTQLL